MKIPIIYRLSHYFLGALSFKFFPILPIFLLYQFIQWKLNIRFFLLNFNCYTRSFNDCFKKGNSTIHTMEKISEFIIGYIFLLLFHSIFRFN